MKNYALNFEDSRSFILNYKVEENEIKVNFASGEKYIVPYSMENERRILEKMKNQILFSEEFEKKQQKRFSSSLKWSLWDVAMISLIAVIMSNGIANYSPVINVIIMCFYTIDIFFRIYSMIDSNVKYKDIQKNKMFLKNEELINSKVRSNQNILCNTKIETRNLITSTPEEKPVFNLNNIDKIDSNELEYILYNIKRDEQFGFDYSTIEEAKTKVLSKKK